MQSEPPVHIPSPEELEMLAKQKEEERALQLKANQDLHEILEVKYPQYNRLEQGWKLLGFIPKKGANKSKDLSYHGADAVPMWRFFDWDRKKKYTCEKLREIRRKQLDEAIGDRTHWDDGTPILRSARDNPGKA